MGIIIEEELLIEELHRNRKIRIYLPTGYEVDKTKRYPVLYMHDGQNMVDPSFFSGHSWEVQKTLEALEKSGLIDGIIVVGIDASEQYRLSEYQHFFNKGTLKYFEHEARKKGEEIPVPQAKEYGQFIVNSLKSKIDQDYRTMPEMEHTGLVGSSCGGNVSLYLLSEYPHIFGKIGVLSTALSMISTEIFERMEQMVLSDQTMIYHHMGEKETNNWVGNQYAIYLAKKLNNVLVRKCNNIKFVVGPGEIHSEVTWKERFPEFIIFAFGTKK